MYFRNYALGKTQLDKCLKSAVSQYLLISNIVNAPEHCSNPKDDSFTIVMDYCEGTYV